MLIVSFTENSDKCCEDDSFEKSPAAKSKVDKEPDFGEQSCQTNNKMRFLRSMMRRQVRFLACDNLLLLQAQTWTPRISNKWTFKNLESRDKRKRQRVPAGRCGTRLWSCELELFSATRASRACDYKSKKRIIIMKKKHISTISSSSTMRALDYQSKKRMIRKNKQQQQKTSRRRI